MPDSSPNHIYKRLSSRYLWQSRWYNVRQDQLRAADGAELTYTVIEKPDAVWVLPVTAAGEIVLIEQYRYTIGGWCLEIPAGNIEPGHTPEAMAARELREEIGGTAERLIALPEFFTMNGIGSERAVAFLAAGVTLGEPDREPTELITLRVVSINEGLHMARTGVIKDGPSALVILMAEPTLRDLQAESTV